MEFDICVPRRRLYHSSSSVFAESSGLAQKTESRLFLNLGVVPETE